MSVAVVAMIANTAMAHTQLSPIGFATSTSSAQPTLTTTQTSRVSAAISGRASGRAYAARRRRRSSPSQAIASTAVPAVWAA